MNNNYDIFISYSRRDYEIADKIVSALNAGSFTYFRDQQGFESGSTFLQSTINAIDCSRLFLCVLSENAYSSEFVIKELEYALQRKDILILPVIVDNSHLPEVLGFRLATLNIANWQFSSSLNIEDDIIRDVNRALKRFEDNWFQKKKDRGAVKRYDVFISCKSEDYDKCTPIYNWLVKKGYRPFFAPISLKIANIQGESIVFGDEIDEALELSDNMIVFTSDSKYVKNGYVKDEWRTFVEEQRSGRKLGSLITILDGVCVADLPIRLRSVQSFTITDYTKGIMRFLVNRNVAQETESKEIERIELFNSDKIVKEEQQRLIEKWKRRRNKKKEKEELKLAKRNNYEERMIKKYGSREKWYKHKEYICEKNISKIWDIQKLFTVKREGKYGFADESGNIVLPCVWSYVWDFSEGLALVSNDDKKYGFINRRGEVIIPCKWNGALSFHKDLAAVKDDNNKWGFINKEGNIVIPNMWNDVMWFSEGLARVMDEHNNYGYIDKKGINVIPCQWKEADAFRESLALVRNERNKFGYINKQGGIEIPFVWFDALDFSDELAAVQDVNGKWGFINKLGEVVIACQWKYAEPFKFGLAAITNNEGKSGYMDKTGNVVIPCQWDGAWDFNDEGFADVWDENNVRYTIDRTGAIISSETS